MRKLCLAAIFVAPCFASASIVYDNMNWTQGWYWAQVRAFNSSGPEGGDEVTLGGTDRAVNQIDIMMYSLWDAGTSDLQVRFYANDGVAGAPGTQLWASGVFTGVGHVQGLQTYSFSVPSVVVPNTFTWTIEQTNRTGSTGDVGPAVANAPSIGSSADGFWYDNAGTWANTGWGGNPVANLGAKIYASPVPEPATFAVLGIGGLLMVRRPRRR